ncbi:sulfite exporter TauE/SafE family protein [Vibrio intestinalis]|uniref:sulfite exporter TauE/SafE family protein n=1 Tax=Vibrio intestinalis TaxID=2933291 RepID=UPI00255A1F23|nr:sulfite exporter TauE/SafE family protein [Vibrio intestinalis]
MDWVVLFCAGLFGGVLNSVAGGGSFITFPALLWFGLPPITANATNTFAACAGYISGAWGFRRDITSQPSKVISIAIFSLLGGALGAWLLLNVSESLFVEAIPWLLLFATLLFLLGEKVRAIANIIASSSVSSKSVATVALTLCLVLVSAYGGFFNAGLGVIVLSYLVIAGFSDIHQMNGLKLLISTCVSLSAIALFLWQGAINWQAGSVVLLGTITGGYLAATVSRSLSQRTVKRFVALSSLCMTCYFFVDVYAV